MDDEMKVFSFRLSAEEMIKLNALAVSQDRSMGYVLRQLINKAATLTTLPHPADAQAVPDVTIRA